MMIMTTPHIQNGQRPPSEDSNRYDEAHEETTLTIGADVRLSPTRFNSPELPNTFGKRLSRTAGVSKVTRYPY